MITLHADVETRLKKTKIIYDAMSNIVYDAMSLNTSTKCFVWTKHD